jgi:hypothetical protein
MHVSDLYEDPLLTVYFGPSRVFDMARRFREVVPDFPQGKGDQGNININHAIWFLYALAKVKSVNNRREAHYAISSMVSTTSLENGESIYISMVNLLSHPDHIKSVKEIRISKVTDFVKVILTDGRSEDFRGPNFVESIHANVDRITILKQNFLADFVSRWEHVVKKWNSVPEHCSIDQPFCYPKFAMELKPSSHRSNTPKII